MVQDPVCGMTFDERDAVGRVRHNKTVYYFCSPGCETAFLENPQTYLSDGRNSGDSHSLFENSKEESR